MEDGGESGIRTRDTVSRIHTFQACAFNHSATSPFYLFLRRKTDKQMHRRKVDNAGQAPTIRCGADYSQKSGGFNR